MQDTSLLNLFKELVERRLERDLSETERGKELGTLAEINSQIEEERKNRTLTVK